MDVLFVLGRVLFGGFFVLSGLRHFQQSLISAFLDRCAARCSNFVPVVPRIAVLDARSAARDTGNQPRGSARIARGGAPWLVPVTLVMHQYWKHTDPMMRINDEVNFLKNIALLGAAWMLLAIRQPWPVSLDR